MRSNLLAKYFEVYKQCEIKCSKELMIDCTKCINNKLIKFGGVEDEVITSLPICRAFEAIIKLDKSEQNG